MSTLTSHERNLGHECTLVLFSIISFAMSQYFQPKTCLNETLTVLYTVMEPV